MNERDDLKERFETTDYINETRKDRDYYYFTNGFQECMNTEVKLLKKQLQTHKDKEDKIKSYVENEEDDMYTTKPTKKYWVKDILQMLESKTDE